MIFFRAVAPLTIAAGIVVAALTGCGTAPAVPATSPAAGPSAAAPTSATAADEEAAIRATLDAYNQSLLDRDFATACAIITEEAAKQFSTEIAASGGPSNLSCEEAYRTIYRNAGAAAVADEVSRSLTVSAVEVTGDRAVVTYGGAVRGQTVSDLKASMVKIDGKWRVEPDT